MADLELRSGAIELRRPVNSSAAAGLPRSVRLNVGLCTEADAPTRGVPIEWMLVTTLPIETSQELDFVVGCYRGRWKIEVYFRTLRSGCCVKHRQFEYLPRIPGGLAVYSVVAWRVMDVMSLGRACPDVQCELIFTTAEWMSVYAILGLSRPPSGCPKLGEVVHAIGRLGGYLGRSATHPGCQTLWIGMQRTVDFAGVRQTFGPPAPVPT